MIGALGCSPETDCKGRRMRSRGDFSDSDVRIGKEPLVDTPPSCIMAKLLKKQVTNFLRTLNDRSLGSVRRSGRTGPIQDLPVGGDGLHRPASGDRTLAGRFDRRGFRRIRIGRLNTAIGLIAGLASRRVPAGSLSSPCTRPPVSTHCIGVASTSSSPVLERLSFEWRTGGWDRVGQAFRPDVRVGRIGSGGVRTEGLTDSGRPEGEEDGLQFPPDLRRSRGPAAMARRPRPQARTVVGSGTACGSTYWASEDVPTGEFAPWRA